jgi:hypothetical protein
MNTFHQGFGVNMHGKRRNKKSSTSLNLLSRSRFRANIWLSKNSFSFPTSSLLRLNLHPSKKRGKEE